MRILIVEDEKRLAMTLKDLLDQSGYLADMAFDGNDGLELAKSGIYDGIILDVMLPGMDGFHLLKRLRAAGNGTPVLVLTAKGDLKDRVTGLDAGVRFYCDPDAAQALTTRAALAREKAEAVQQLNAVYDELTGWQYTPENAALLAQKKQSALDEIEAADSTGLPAALFTAGKAALEQVDPILKTVTVTSWPAASLVRGQALSQASLNGGKADVPGRFVWKEPDTRPQAGGSYPVVFVPADSRRYTSVEGQAALTVNEPAPAPTAAKTRSTSGASSLLVTPGKAFCSWMAVLRPRFAAARTTGPET